MSVSKDGLFAGSDSIDLGPSIYWPENWPVRKTQIAAAKPAQLRAHLRQLAPNEPGVYAMINAADEIIYIGKAKDLRKRLFCYIRSKGRDRKARKIISRAKAIAWEVLPSSFTAFLRELELIRRWRPTWNVQGQPLRRRHAYICLGNRPAPYLTIARKPPRHLVAMFGPVPITKKTQAAVRWLNDGFRLRDCPPGAIEFFPAPNPLFPIAPPSGCLRLELGACSGPCTAEVSRSKYHQSAREVRAFLEGRDRAYLVELERRMIAASLEQRYEAAARLRDQWATLTWLVERLDNLKSAQKTLSFVYPMPAPDGRTIWYLLHGARVLGCVSEPRDRETAEAAVERLGRIYGAGNAEPLIDAYEPIDGMVLILGWFRKYPRQKRHSLTAAAASDIACRFLD